MMKLMLWRFHRHIGLCITLIITTLLLGSSVAFGQDCIQDFTDASGQVTIRVRTGSWVGPLSHNTTSVNMDTDFVLVGGGAAISQSPSLNGLFGQPGALLTASYPDANLTTWHAKSKDHGTAYKHYLRAYAIGMRLSGVSSVQLRSYMVWVTPQPSSGNNPTAGASVPLGYLLVGGGARATGKPSAGLLLTASYPSSAYEWTASAKDHHFSDPTGTVEAFAIGIQPNIPGFGVLSVSFNNTSTYASMFASYGATTIQAPTGWAQSSVGGRVDYGTGPGRLLTAVFPICDSSNRPGAQAISKDHLGPYYSPGDTYAYTVFIQKQ